MKTRILFFALMLLTTGLLAQVYQGSADEVTVTPPVFTGEQQVVLADEASLSNYLIQEFNYPHYDATHFVQGTEVIQFMVHPDGSLSDFEVVNSVSPDIDAELIRVLKTTEGMWRPGMNNEGAVAMYKEVALACKVGDSNNPKYQTDFKALATRHFIRGTKQLWVKDNPAKALRAFDKGINYLPFDSNLLLMRGYCRYMTGDQSGALADWKVVKDKTDIDNFSDLMAQYSDHEEFVEFAEIFAQHSQK